MYPEISIIVEISVKHDRMLPSQCRKTLILIESQENKRDSIEHRTIERHSTIDTNASLKNRQNIIYHEHLAFSSPFPCKIYCIFLFFLLCESRERSTI